MSKKLILYRHGKSDWDANYENDHERPLAERGKKSSSLMGRLLSSAEQLPDLIICSSAKRARETLEFSIKSGNWESEIQVHEDLYFGGLESVLNIIQSCPKNYNSIMLIGHEPKWSNITEKFIGGGEIRFPTAAMCRIDFKCQKWVDVDFGKGQMRWLLQPSFFGSHEE